MMTQAAEQKFNASGIEIHDESGFKGMRKAGQLAAQTLDMITEHVIPGVTTEELDHLCNRFITKNGAIPAPLNYKGFPKSICTSINHVVCHGIPGDKKLAAGDLLLIDFGATINGYHSDMTRTFILGQADAKQKEIYQTVLSAQQAAMDALTIGISGNELHQKAKGILDQSPYAAYQGEGLGHGLGLDLHELPLMGMGQDLAIKKHTVITIEPGIYIPGWGGVRIEDDVVLTDDGLLQLTQSPRELMEL